MLQIRRTGSSGFVGTRERALSLPWLMTPNALALAAWLALIAAVEIQVRLVEEPYLARTHGAAYADSARRTGRFVPGLGLGVDATTS